MSDHRGMPPIARRKTRRYVLERASKLLEQKWSDSDDTDIDLKTLHGSDVPKISTVDVLKVNVPKSQVSLSRKPFNPRHIKHVGGEWSSSTQSRSTDDDMYSVNENVSALLSLKDSIRKKPQHNKKHTQEYGNNSDNPSLYRFVCETCSEGDRSSSDYSDEMNYRTPRLNPEERVVATKGKLVNFYRNGDQHFKGLPTSISTKQFTAFETLLVWLNEKIPTVAGVRYIFRIPDGREIKDLSSFETMKSYVVSSTKHIVRIPYGRSRERFWSNKAPSAGKIRKAENNLFLQELRNKKSQSHPNSRVGSYRSYASPASFRPRTLTIISNTNRDSEYKVILNPQTMQAYEDWLVDVSNTVRLEHPPITSLYTARAPYRQVRGYSELRQMKNYHTFLAVGQERLPLELSMKLQPSREQPRRPVQRQTHKPAANTVEFFAYDRERYSFHYPSPPDSYAGWDSTQNKPVSKPFRGTLNHLLVRRHYTDVEQWRGREDHVRPQYAQHINQGRTVDPGVNHRGQYYSLDHDDETTSDPAEEDDRRETRHSLAPANRSVERVQIHGRSREFYAPDYTPVERDGSQPEKRLRLDWVYGFRGRDARNNLHVLPSSGKLVYYVAAVCVVYDRITHTQHHYLGHTEDIACMAIHPNNQQPFVATGEKIGKSSEAGIAPIRIWNHKTMATLTVIGKDQLEGGINSVAFSKMSGDSEEGTYLLAIDEGERHTLSVWDWQNSRILTKTTTSYETVLCGSFHPDDFTSIVTFGKQHLSFWKLAFDHGNPDSAKLFRDKKSGVFPEEEIPNFITSMAFSINGDVIIGDSSGRITLWTEDDDSGVFLFNSKCSENMTRGHVRSVLTLCMLGDGILLSGGGHDIKAWDSMNLYKLLKTRTIPESAGFVRTLVPQNAESTDGILYIGTTNNLILEGSLQNKFTVVVQGHCEDLWGLVTDSEENAFLTAGSDQQVMKWNALQHSLIWQVSVEKPCKSVDLDPQGRLVVLGTSDGRFIVLNAFNGRHISSTQVGVEELDSVKFSPDGQYLAVGSHDNSIYLYEVLDEGLVFRKHKSGILKGHQNKLTHIDWSTCGKYLQSVSGDFDLLFWDIDMMKETPAEYVKDVSWETQNCILGYDVLEIANKNSKFRNKFFNYLFNDTKPLYIGAWSTLEEGENINAMDRSNFGNSLAVGDNQGAVKLYRYPCIAYKPKHQRHKRYSGHVSNVRYSFDDSYIISTGGTDAAILQWALTDVLNYT